MRPAAITLLLSLVTSSGAAQSLFVADGERAAEAVAGWSVGPFSQGLETHAALSLDGRWDVGFGVHVYRATLGGPADVSLTQWTPFVRYFLVKEGDDEAPVSLSMHAQFVQEHYGGGDEGWYALAGAQLWKRLAIAEGFDLYPYLAFSAAADSVAFGGAAAERSLYLTRQFGVHGLMALGPSGNTWLRVTAEEHAFRRETYRAVRLGVVRRF